MWGAKGGANSRKNLTPAKRSALAKKAARAKWAKYRAEVDAGLRKATDEKRKLR